MPPKKTNVLKPGSKSPFEVDTSNLDPELLARANTIKAKIAEIEAQIASLRAEEKKSKTASQKAEKKIGAPSMVRYVELIQKDCSEYAQAVIATGKVLYRGSGNTSMPAYVARSRSNRSPDNTPLSIQKGFDKLLSSQGFTALRGNSIFTTSRQLQAARYGEPYIIFPKNGFSFTWSPKVPDFYHELIEEHEIPTWSEFVSHYSQDTSSIYVDLEILSDTLNSIIYALQGIRFEFPIHQKQTEKIEDEIYNLQELLEEDHEISPYPSVAIKQANNYIKRLTKIIQGIEISPEIKSIFYKDKDAKDYLNSIKNYQNTLQKISKELKIPELADTAVLRNLAYTNQNLEAALKSDNEVMINGEYYAFKYDLYYDILKYLRQDNRKKPISEKKSNK